MNKKQPVTLHSYHKTTHRYQKLKVCNHCRQYTMIPDEPCPHCGKERLISIEEKAAQQANRATAVHVLLLILIALAGVLFGQTFLQMSLAAAAGIAAVAVYVLIQQRVKHFYAMKELGKLIARDEERIVEGVFRNWEQAIELWKTEPVRTYEMLREISTLQRSEMIRIQQVALLNTFILRKDMEIELEPLMLRHFEPMLAELIGELAKVKRSAIKERAIKYVSKYEIEVLEMEQGEQILSHVVGAAVRMKPYVASNPNFIARYARYLPKDRFLRLYNMLSLSPSAEWGHLADEVFRIYKERYQWDADFQSGSKGL
ncbi:hypothetical protein [Paenibacillus sp. 1001270B_150601_E10]|uniref:hypothetical protein n=1 Tax=Paenibacillus sp. 1001270B_150601_E10 TaxID=2787079 RepID=UPI00189FE968|nr:hypothetical protein [Paenibacillus sp. 1001270B_150601_E10]